MCIFIMQTKSFRTNVLIDNDRYPKDDLQFIRAKGFKPTNLLRMKIKELREIEEGAPSPKLLIEQLNKARIFRDSILKFVDDKGLIDEMFKTINL